MINLFGNDYSIAVVVTGILLTICVALVVLGGIQRIASVSSVIVPFMAVFLHHCLHRDPGIKRCPHPGCVC